MPKKIQSVRLEFGWWLYDTSDLSLEETGLLIRLSCLFWKMDGQLNDDNRVVAQALKLSRQKYQHLKARLIAAYMLRVENGMLWPYEGLNAIVHAQMERDRHSHAGKLGARARWGLDEVG